MNEATYHLMFEVEVALREFIIERLAKTSGPRWWRSQIPPDVSEDAISGARAEREVHWAVLTPHHPIYYCDFAALRKIIERRDNWRDAFAPVFRRSAVIAGPLERLEPVRNAVAHSRRVSDQQLKMAQEFHESLRHLIGAAHFDELLLRCTTAPSITDQMSSLAHEIRESAASCLRFEGLAPMAQWLRVKDEWWLDEGYLGVSLAPVYEVHGLFEQYCELPVTRGSGWQREVWVKESRLDATLATALTILDGLSERR